MAGTAASMTNDVLAEAVWPSVSVPFTLTRKAPFAPEPESGALQEVPLPETVPAVTAPLPLVRLIEVTDAAVSGLLEAMVSTGDEVAFAGFGAAVGLSAGALKSKTTDVLAWEELPASSIADRAIVFVPDPSAPAGVVV
jgi:hypothetical protein